MCISLDAKVVKQVDTVTRKRQLNEWGRNQDYCWNEQERRETKKVFAHLSFDTSVAVKKLVFAGTVKKVARQ